MTDPTARNTRGDLMLLSAVCVRFFRAPDDPTAFQGNAIVQALAHEGIRTFSGLLMINEDEIAEMTSNPTTVGGDRIPLPASARNLIKAFLAYYHKESHKLKRLANFRELDVGRFDEYRLTKYNSNAGISRFGTHTAKDERSASEAWKKSLRVPDSKEFRELKQDYDWARFKDDWIVTLTSYGLMHLIDPDYIPTDLETDRLQQNWFYGILVSKCKSPNSRAVVLNHKEDKNTREIWDAIDKRNGSSMASEIAMNQLMSYLTSVKFKGSLWEKSTQNKFLLHFDEQLRQWDERSGEPLSDRMKTRYLSQAVMGVSNLDKVLTTNLSAMKAAGNPNFIRYDEYLRLLIEQADVNDGINTNVVRHNAARRTVNNAETHFDDDYEIAMHETFDPDDLDIDTPISYFMVNQAQQS